RKRSVLPNATFSHIEMIFGNKAIAATVKLQNVPCSARLLAIIGDRIGRRIRHDEADGPLRFLLKMREQTRRAGKYGNALERGQRKADLEKDRGNGAVDVDGKWPAECFRQYPGDGLQHVEVGALESALLGEAEQDIGARIAIGVLRVAEAGDCGFGLAHLADQRCRNNRCIRALRRLDKIVKEITCRLSTPEHDGT